MATIFTKILSGEIPCFKVLEDDKYLAFLDIRPVKPGHTLCIPKEEVNYIFDLSDDALAELMVFAKKAALKLKAGITCKRIGIMVAGLEVPHAHIHLIPMDEIKDLNFANAQSMDFSELKEIHSRIGG